MKVNFHSMSRFKVFARNNTDKETNWISFLRCYSRLKMSRMIKFGNFWNEKLLDQRWLVIKKFQRFYNSPMTNRSSNAIVDEISKARIFEVLAILGEVLFSNDRQPRCLESHYSTTLERQITEKRVLIHWKQSARIILFPLFPCSRAFERHLVASPPQFKTTLKRNVLRRCSQQRDAIARWQSFGLVIRLDVSFRRLARSFPRREKLSKRSWLGNRAGGERKRRRRDRRAADVRVQLLKTANALVAVKVDKFQLLVWKSIIAREPPKPPVSPGISNLPRE